MLCRLGELWDVVRNAWIGVPEIKSGEDEYVQ